MVRHNATKVLPLSYQTKLWLSSEDCKVWNNQRRNYYQVWNPAHWGRFWEFSNNNN